MGDSDCTVTKKGSALTTFKTLPRLPPSPPFPFTLPLLFAFFSVALQSFISFLLPSSLLSLRALVPFLLPPCKRSRSPQGMSSSTMSWSTSPTRPSSGPTLHGKRTFPLACSSSRRTLARLRGPTPSPLQSPVSLHPPGLNPSRPNVDPRTRQAAAASSPEMVSYPRPPQSRLITLPAELPSIRVTMRMRIRANRGTLVSLRIPQVPALLDERRLSQRSRI